MLIGFVLLSAAAPATAQSLGTIERIPGNVPNYYYFARTGEATITVSVWGSVRNPGTYEVRENINVGELLSLTGGPALLGQRYRNRRPEISVQISRPSSGGREIVYTAQLNEMISDQHEYPTLRHGDILMVETIPLSPPFGWRDAVSIVSAISVVFLAVDRIARVAR